MAVDKSTILERLDLTRFYMVLVPSLKVNDRSEATGLCPFHNDRHPSLSVNLEKGLWNCLAGFGGGDIFSFYQRLKEVDFPTAIRKIATMQGIREISPQVVATFEYRNENGDVLYRKERLEPGRDGRRKEFRFLHQKGDRWVSGRGCEPVPYNLPTLLKNKYAFIVEGEGKVDLLKAWGFAATCLDSGANSPWKEDYLRAFEGKEKVAILPDNDEPGRSFALKIAHALHGKVGVIKIVDLPGLQKGEDVIDWMKIDGNTKEQLMEIVKQAPVWTPESMEIPGVVRLETVTPERVTWFWPGYIPMGKITILDGDPGLGKSTITLDLAARVSTGSPLPDGSPGVMGGAVLMTLEDGLADTVVPRLGAMGADLFRIVALEFVTGEDGKSRIPSIEDIDAIVRACQKVDARLIVIDPLMGYLGSRTNSWRDQDVRQALGPLAKMAENIGVAVLLVRHLNKSGGNQSIYRGGGSIGIGAAARSVLLVAKDPENENRRVLASTKINVASPSPSLAFHIEGVGGTSRIVWDGISNHTADALLAVPASQEERSARDEAREFLREILAEGPVEVEKVQKQANEVRIAEGTLRRAKKDLGVVSQKPDSDFKKKGPWFWVLPQDAQNSPKVVNKNNDHLGRTMTILGNTDPPILEVD